MTDPTRARQQGRDAPGDPDSQGDCGDDPLAIPSSPDPGQGGTQAPAGARGAFRNAAAASGTAASAAGLRPGVDRGPGTVASPPPAEGRSDDELVQAYLAGDKTAFGHLVIKHRWSVHLTCLRVLNDHQEAQDQMQNTFEKAFRAKAARYRGRCEFGAWLRTIAEHESRNAVRARDMRQAKAMWEGRDQSERGARDPGEMTVARITIAEALAQLPAEFRETVLNVYQRGLTKQEAGKVEGISPSTVGSRCTRAKALLAEYLQEAGNH